MSTTYKKYRTANDEPIQVDSAIRDGSGKNIENNYAKQNGSYETLHSGSATTTKSIEPVTEGSGVEQITPFLFEASGTENNTTETVVGNTAQIKSIQGNSIAFNQIIKSTRGTQTVNDVTFTTSLEDGVRVITASGTASADGSYDICYTATASQVAWKPIVGHKYLFRGAPITSSLNRYYISINTFGNDVGEGIIKNWSTSSNQSISIKFKSGTVFNNFKFYPQLFDLTLMGLENINTIKEFERIFPRKAYSPYAGSILSAKSSALKTIGKNQWDEVWESGTLDNNGQDASDASRIRSKNFIRVIPNTEYVFIVPSLLSKLCFYDIQQNYISTYAENVNNETVVTIPNTCHYIRFSIVGASYNNDIAINLNWDEGSLEYEESDIHTYDLPIVDLRSVGNVKDELLPDGTVIRRVGTLDLGSVDWTYDTYNTAFVNTGTVANLKDCVYGANEKAPNLLCPLYLSKNTYYLRQSDDRIITTNNGQPVTNRKLFVKDTSYGTNASSFKTAMSGIYVYFELDTPVIETVEGTFLDTIEINDYGTLEFVPYGDPEVLVPQGNQIFYPANYVGMLDDLYSYTEGDATALALSQDLIDGSLVVGKALTSKQLENISDDSGIFQEAIFNLEGVGSNGNTQEASVASVIQQRALLGNSVAFNQLVKNGNFADTSDWAVGNCTISVSNNIATITPTNPHSSFRQNNIFSINGHKYLYSFDIKYTSGESFDFNVFGVGKFNQPGTGNWVNYSLIITPTNTNNQFNIYDYDNTTHSAYQLRNVKLFDLTLMFGAGNEPTIQEFNRMFPEAFYEQNIGELISSQSNKLISTGRNLFDGQLKRGNLNQTTGQEESHNYYSISVNPIKVIPGIDYYCNIFGDDLRVDLYTYDANMNFISLYKQRQKEDSHVTTLPHNCSYVKLRALHLTDPTVTVTTLDAQILFQLAWEIASTEYEDYTKIEYNLPNVELRSAGTVRDELLADGTLIRRVGVIDISTIPASSIYAGSNNRFSLYRSAITPRPADAESNTKLANLICSKYTTFAADDFSVNQQDKSLSLSNGGMIVFRDSSCSDTASFLANNSGTLLYYELETYTTEETENKFPENINVESAGTLEYVSENEIPAPQGSRIFYPADYVKLIDDLNTYTEAAINVLAKKEYVDDTRADLTQDLVTGELVVDKTKNIFTTRTVEDVDVSCPPITFGIAGGEAEISTGYTSFKYLEGSSKTFNQIVPDGNFNTSDSWSGVNGNATISNNELQYTITTAYTTNANRVVVSGGNDYSRTFVNGHKYLITVMAKSTATHGMVQFGAWSVSLAQSGPVCWIDLEPLTTTYRKCSVITQFNVTTSNTYDLRLGLFDNQGTGQAGDVYSVKNFMIIDLTQIYGPGKEPLTVEEFEKDFPLDYYSTNVGTILDATSASLISRGKNQFDGVLNIKTFINSNGTPITVNYCVTSNYIKVIGGEEYEFSVNAEKYKYAYINEFDINKKFVRQTGATASTRVVQTLDENTAYVRLCFGDKNSTTITTEPSPSETLAMFYNTFGVTYNEPYEEYRAEVVELPNIPLRSIGDIKDIAYVEGGGVRRVGRKVFDGVDESWNLSGNDTVTYRFSIALADGKTQGKGLCNLLPWVESGVSVDQECVGITGGVLYVRVNRNRIADTYSTDAFKTWLSNNNLIINYELTNEEELTENEGWEEEIFVDNYGTLEFTTDPVQVPQVEQPYFIEYTISLTEFLDSTYMRADGIADNLALQEDIDKILDGRLEVGHSLVTDSIYSAREIDSEYDTCPTAVFTGVGGEAEVKAGYVPFEELHGNTVVFNQILQLRTTQTTNYDIIGTYDSTTKSRSYSGTSTGSAWCNLLEHNCSVIGGHKYLFKTNVDITGTTLYYTPLGSVGCRNTIIYTADINRTENVYLVVPQGETVNITGLQVQLFDLTDMFGAGNEPTSVEEFNSLFPEAYYEYNTGELLSSKSSALVVRGMNQFDKNDSSLRNNSLFIANGATTGGIGGTNYSIVIPIIPGEKYAIYRTNVVSSRLRAASYPTLPVTSMTFSHYGQSDSGNQITVQTGPEDRYLFINLDTNQTNFLKQLETLMIRLYYDTPNVDYEDYEEQVITLPNIELKSAGSVYDVAYSTGGGERRIGTYTFTGEEADGTLAIGEQISSGLYRYYFTGLEDMKTSTAGDGLCDKLPTDKGNWAAETVPCVRFGQGNKAVYFYLTQNYSTKAELKAALAGMTLHYVLEVPTEIEDNPGWTTTIKVNNYGTLEFKSEQEIQVPQAYYIMYTANLVDFLDSAYERTNGTADNIALATDVEEVKTALGGTLRQCLCVKDSLNFNNTRVIDLSSLNWTRNTSYTNAFFVTPLVSSIKANGKCLSTNYQTIANTSGYGFGTSANNLEMTISSTESVILIRDDTYSDADTFKAAMKGVLLAYEKA